MRVNFRALSPRVYPLRQFREKYGSPVLVGISWHSIRETKELPSLAHWAEFLKATEVDFVSLQYGDAASEAVLLSRSADRKVILDQTVDSLIDLDIYAAQVAACDVVVTISNTCAHMAGALGKRHVSCVGRCQPPTVMAAVAGREAALVSLDDSSSLQRKAARGRLCLKTCVRVSKAILLDAWLTPLSKHKRFLRTPQIGIHRIVPGQCSSFRVRRV